MLVGSAWPGDRPELAPWGPSAGWAPARAAIPATPRPLAPQPRCPRPAPAAAEELATSRGARPPRRARCPRRHAYAAGRTRTAPAASAAWLPVLVLHPAHAVGEAWRRGLLPLPTPLAVFATAQTLSDSGAQDARAINTIRSTNDQ